MIKNKSPEEIIGDQGLIKQLTQSILERALEGELTTELGYDKHSPTGNKSVNSRNGYSPKTVKGPSGELTPQIPRNRTGDFNPKIIKKTKPDLMVLMTK